MGFWALVLGFGVGNLRLEEDELKFNPFSSNFRLKWRQSQITGRTTLELPKLLF
jgi:hypothetical protein